MGAVEAIPTDRQHNWLQYSDANTGCDS